MYVLGKLDYPVGRPDLVGSLWHCDKCESFVSIHRAEPIDCAMCPTCAGKALKFCATFDSLLGKHFIEEKSN